VNIVTDEEPLYVRYFNSFICSIFDLNYRGEYGITV